MLFIEVIERLEMERHELNHKIENLEIFLSSTNPDLVIDRDLLLEQLEVMKSYRNILGKRITTLKKA